MKVLLAGPTVDNLSPALKGFETKEKMPSCPETKETNKKRYIKKKRPPFSVSKFHELYESTNELLGEGSHAKVKGYRNLANQKLYAVKEVVKTAAIDRRKVLKEVEIFHHCGKHPHIMELYQFLEETDKYYLVFERVYGGNLLTNIQRRGKLTEADASRIMQQLASGLKFLHEKGIAHRDLKPENVLCETAEQLTPVRIIDFDLGSDRLLLDPSGDEDLMTPVGSAEYMAPEVVDAWTGEATSYDKKCDVWSLGVILYIMLSGTPPFYAKCGADCGWERGEACSACQHMLFRRIRAGEYDFPSNTWRHISERAKDLIRHLLVCDPLHRYSAADILEHPWIKEPVPLTPLFTPTVLGRSNSSQVLEVFSEAANAFHRKIVSVERPRDIDEEWSYVIENGTGFNNDNDEDNEQTSQASFYIGESPDEDDESNANSNGVFDHHGSGEITTTAPIAMRRAPAYEATPVIRLSPPCSSLAIRRRRGSVSLPSSIGPTSPF